MIPKIIHYCWYGNTEKGIPINILQTIESWKVQCPDFKIIKWSEENTPINEIKYIRDALKHQKYAFAADYMRFYVLYHYGGIYLDTDMYLIKPLDEFMCDEMFVGREDKYNAAMGIIGMKKGNELAKSCLNYYDRVGFNVVSPIIVTNLVTSMLYKYGYSQVDETQHLSNGMVVYQSDFFYPIHYSHKYPFNEILEHKTPNTRGIHWGHGSWDDEFSLLSKKQYSEGFSMAYSRIKRTPFLPLKYYVKLFKYIGNYIGIWNR